MHRRTFPQHGEINCPLTDKAEAPVGISLAKHAPRNSASKHVSHSKSLHEGRQKWQRAHRGGARACADASGSMRRYKQRDENGCRMPSRRHSCRSAQRNDKPGGLDEKRYLDAASSLQQCRTDQCITIRCCLHVAVVFGAISARSHIKNGIPLCPGTSESLRALGVTPLEHLVVFMAAQRTRCKDIFCFLRHP